MSSANEGASSSSAAAMTVVKAVYSFKGSHNDELNFKKGAMITLTQKEDGGWWEGTLDGKTGWFPSNYVSEIDDIASGNVSSPTSVSAASDASSDLASKRVEFRQQGRDSPKCCSTSNHCTLLKVQELYNRFVCVHGHKYGRLSPINILLLQ
jgi:hypothetical protein